MAEAEAHIPLSKSVSAFPWQVPDTGLHPDQSFLGKPIDPEIVARVRGSLRKYKGPKSIEERDKIIADKAAAKQRANKEQTEIYLSYLEKVKAESVPSFKLPEDSMKGRPSSDDYIKANVRKGLRELRDKTSDYKAWVENVKIKKEMELHEKVRAKLQADESFKNDALAREQERARRDEEIQKQVHEQQQKYWRWLKGMKVEVSKRPGSAPPPQPTGAESTEALTKKKRAESTQALRKQTAEYREWLASVSQARFELPHHPVVDREEQERRIAEAKRRREEDRKSSKAYFEKVRQMEKKHDERIQRALDVKKQADDRYNADRGAAADMLASKLLAEQERQRAIAEKSREELREMYHRVKAKPLHIEHLYSK